MESEIPDLQFGKPRPEEKVEPISGGDAFFYEPDLSKVLSPEEEDAKKRQGLALDATKDLMLRNSPTLSLMRLYQANEYEDQDEDIEVSHQHLNEEFKTNQFDRPMKYKRAFVENQWQKEEEELQRVIENAPQDFASKAERFMYGAASTFLDPINVASAFIAPLAIARMARPLVAPLIAKGLPTAAKVAAQTAYPAAEFGAGVQATSRIATGVASNVPGVAATYAARNATDLEFSEVDAVVSTLMFPVVQEAGIGLFKGIKGFTSVGKQRFGSAATESMNNGKFSNMRDAAINIAKEDFKPTDLNQPASEILSKITKSFTGAEPKTVGQAITLIQNGVDRGYLKNSQVQFINDVLFSEGIRPVLPEVQNPGGFDLLAAPQADIDRMEQNIKEFSAPDADTQAKIQEIKNSTVEILDTLKVLEDQSRVVGNDVSLIESTRENVKSLDVESKNISTILKNAIPCKGKGM